ncbi:MAG TPA: hypothetical protein VN947_23435 [Polyangia bacterium]|nr:hypothetical protein [Polyangia bacterium]
MIARIPLIPVVLIALFASLILSVVVLLGVPMAGAWSALAATALAGALTVLMALGFSHGEHVGAGR